MKHKIELNNSRLATPITRPEKSSLLPKFIDEMPVVIPDCGNDEINIMNLKAYNNSLGILLKKYTGDFASTKNKL